MCDDAAGLYHAPLRIPVLKKKSRELIKLINGDSGGHKSR
jgi:hypothetical protein